MAWLLGFTKSGRVMALYCNDMFFQSIDDVDVITIGFICSLCKLFPSLFLFFQKRLRNPEAMVELMSSPFIKQQLDSFSLALAQGTVDFSQFSIQNAPSGTIPSVRAFLEAIVNSSTPENATDSTSNKDQAGQDKPTE